MNQIDEMLLEMLRSHGVPAAFDGRWVTPDDTDIGLRGFGGLRENGDHVVASLTVQLALAEGRLLRETLSAAAPDPQAAFQSVVERFPKYGRSKGHLIHTDGVCSSNDTFCESADRVPPAGTGRGR